MGPIQFWRDEYQGTTDMPGAIEEEQGTRREKSRVQERYVVNEGLYLCCEGVRFYTSKRLYLGVIG